MKFQLFFVILTVGILDAVEIYREGIVQSPLLKISEPLFKLVKFYCSASLNQLDLEDSAFLINRLIAADTLAHDDFDLQEHADLLWKCAKYYKGDDDWAGFEIIVEDDPTTTTPEPNFVARYVARYVSDAYNWTLRHKFINKTSRRINSLNHSIRDFVNNTYTLAKEYIEHSVVADFVTWLGDKCTESSGKITKNEVTFNHHVHKIVVLLPRIAEQACIPHDLFPIVWKFLRKLEELMQAAVLEEVDDTYNRAFCKVRYGLQDCLEARYQYYWELEEEIVEKEENE